jgi:glycosyltransferase involved in cell wall biosynthesis
MHLLHVTPYYAPAYAFGGVTRAVEGLARALVRRGHAVTVLTTDALNQAERIQDDRDSVQDSVRVIRIRNVSAGLRGRANLSTPLAMRRAILDLIGGVDVVHCHEFRTVENLLVTPVAARARVPLILSPHGTLTYETGRRAIKTLWDRLFGSMTARRFHAVVGLTLAERAEALALWDKFGINGAKSAVIPNGIDLAEFNDLRSGAAFRQRYGLGDSTVCLFMGRLHRRKGIDVLIEAFRRANVPDARLVIAGADEGMLAALQPLLDERIVVTGYLGGADRLAALAAADVFALPAIGEGLSMAALEAMGAGVPVILSPGCNLPEAAEAGAGLVVPAAIDPLAAALTALLTDPVTRRAMGDQGRVLVAARFTWEAVAAQYELLYADLRFRALDGQ